MCVCVRERERERERGGVEKEYVRERVKKVLKMQKRGKQKHGKWQRDKQLKHRQTDRQRDTQTDKKTKIVRRGERKW